MRGYVGLCEDMVEWGGWSLTLSIGPYWERVLLVWAMVALDGAMCLRGSRVGSF
jgi:hypothetical protein